MEKVMSRSYVLRIAAFDAVLVTLALLMPIVSHAFGVGIRFLEPMRLALFAAVLFVPERKNAYLMAFVLPWFSFAIIGMPVWWKAVMMSVELVVNVFILYRLLDLKVHSGLALLISVLMAKGLYYIAKYLLIQFAVLPQMPVVENVPMILLSVVLLSVLFVCGSKIVKR